MTRVQRICSFDGCSTKHFSSGYCEKHYRRWKRTGNPAIVRREVGLSVEERFWRKVQKGDAEHCWPWLGRTSQDGYGWFTISYHNEIPAHRFSYQNLVSLIPTGLTIDHLCRNIICVNPAHMEPVTNAENVRREWAHRKRQ